MTNNQIAQKWQLSMKEMRASRNHRDRQSLRSSPVHHIGQGYGVVVLTMQNECAAMQRMGDRGNIKTCHSGPHQNQLLGRRLQCGRLYTVADNKRAERKPSQGKRQGLRFGTATEVLRGVRYDREQILQFATPFVVHPLRCANAAEIKSYGMPATLDKSTRQGLDHFVVHCSAKQRVRVRYHRHSARTPIVQPTWQVFQRLDHAGWALNQESAGLSIHNLLPML